MNDGQKNGGLRLRAEDAEDLRIIAACLQDALVTLSDIQFQREQRCFMLVANRFRWENCEESAADLPITISAEESADPTLAAACSSYERVNCGIRFDNVSQVRQRGFDQRDRGRILELLTMEVDTGADGSGRVVMLVFAGGAAIRLEGDHITCHVGDVGEPWPTQWRPYHPDKPAGEAA